MMTVSDYNELFKMVSDAVSNMDSNQLRNLAVGTYLEVRETLRTVMVA